MIGAARYFAPRYFAPRYFPKVGADRVAPTGHAGSRYRYGYRLNWSY